MKTKYSFNLIILSLALLILLTGSCKNQDKTEKFQNSRKKIIDVQNSLIDIDTEIILTNLLLYIIDDYLIVLDMKPNSDRGIHLFNKNTFKYITSTGVLGHGPGEIIRYGRIGVDNDSKVFWVPDHGKQMLMKFPLDSVLQNPNFKPTEGVSLLKELFIERFEFINDSIALGKAVNTLSSSSYQMAMAKLNVVANKTSRYGYENAEAVGKKSNSVFALSKALNLYVNAYWYCDLLTICDLQGNLLHNIYGSDRLENKENKKTYFTGVDILDDFIVASYIGDNGIIVNEFQRQEGNLPTKFLIFSKEGDYISTFETKHKFSSFCVDEVNNRVIVHFRDRAIPLAYFAFDTNLAVAK